MGILTEEELKYIEALISLPNTKGIWRAKFKLVLASHRQLLSANAELSFKNMKLIESFKSIAESSTNLADSLRIQAHLTLEELK